MAKVRLRVLGGLEFFDSSNQLIHLSVKKAKALFVYLAVQPDQSFSRDQLAEILWPSAAKNRARQSLRQSISDLRNHLPDFDKLISVTHSHLQANRENLIVDLLCFEQLARSHDSHSLSEAYRFYRGHFLEGFKIRSDPFVHWYEEVAQHTLERTINVIESLSEHKLLEGDTKAAIQLCQQLITLDPIRESAYRSLMSLFAKQGNTAAASEQYSNCCKQLKKRLGAEPETQTRHLYTRIKKQINSPDLPNQNNLIQSDPVSVTREQKSDNTNTANITETENIGRKNELNTLCTCIEQVYNSKQGQCVFVSGDDGIGKTYLISQVSVVAQDFGFKVGHARFFNIDTSHENGIRDLILDVVKISLPSVASTDDELPILVTGHFFHDQPKYDIYLAVLSALLGFQIPKRLTANYSALTQTAREHLVETIILNILTRISTETPLMLVLDDTQHMTAQMSRLVNAIAVLTCTRTMILIAISNKLKFSPELNTKELSTVSIYMKPLSQTDACLALNISQRHHCYDLLYLTWQQRLYPNVRSDQAINLAELLSLAQQQLSLGDQQALKIASILGLRFNLDVLTILLDDPHYKPTELIKQGYLQTFGNRLEFTHALTQQALYSLLDENDKTALHYKAASYYLFGNTHLHAYHLDAAGSRDTAKAYISAAISAREDYKLDMAAYFFERAISTTSDVTEKYFSAIQKGDMLLESDRVALAVQAYDLAQRFTENKHEQAIAWLGMSVGLIQRKQYAAARSLLERCEPVLRERADHKVQARLYYYLAQTMACLDIVDASSRYNKIAFEHARQAQSSYWQTRIALSLGKLYFNQLQLGRAFSNLDFAIRLARENDHGELEIQILTQLAKVKLFQANFQGAATDLEHVMTVASLTEDHESVLEILCTLCLLDFYKGKFSRLEHHTELATRLCAIIGTSSKDHHIASYQLLAAYHNKNQTQLQALQKEVQNATEAKAIAASYVLAPILALIEHDRNNAQRYLHDTRKTLEYLNGPKALECCFLSIEAAIHHQLWDLAEEIADKLIMLIKQEPLPFFIMCAERVRILSQIAQNHINDATRTELVDIFSSAKFFGLTVHLPAYEKALNHLTDPIQV